MSQENSGDILYEKPGPEKALVITANDASALEHPSAKNILSQIGLTSEQFWKLLTLDFVPLEGPKQYPVTNKHGEKIEDVTERIVQMPIGNVQVLDVVLHPSVVDSHDGMSFHLRVGEHGGFEAIWALAGEARLMIPREVNPVAPGVYVSSQKRDEVFLTPLALAIIPAPAANNWSFVGPGFKFRYICNPPWSPDHVRGTLDQ